MFNVTIINAKGSIKKIAILIVTLILLFIVTRFIQNLKSTEVFKINLSSKLVNCLNNEIPAINEIVSKSNTTIKEENEEDTKDFSERILGVELSRLKESEKIEENPVETPGENIENKPDSAVGRRCTVRSRRGSRQCSSSVRFSRPAL